MDVLDMAVVKTSNSCCFAQPTNQPSKRTNQQTNNNESKSRFHKILKSTKSGNPGHLGMRN